jgi:hypothetical protein
LDYPSISDISHLNYRKKPSKPSKYTERKAYEDDPVGGQGGGVWAPDVGVAAPGSSAVGGMEEQVGVACGGGIESWEGRRRKRR